jgi:hypothetical protein
MLSPDGENSSIRQLGCEFDGCGIKWQEEAGSPFSQVFLIERHVWAEKEPNAFAEPWNQESAKFAHEWFCAIRANFQSSGKSAV